MRFALGFILGAAATAAGLLLAAEASRLAKAEKAAEALRRQHADDGAIPIFPDRPRDVRAGA